MVATGDVWLFELKWIDIEYKIQVLSHAWEPVYYQELPTCCPKSQRIYLKDANTTATKVYNSMFFIRIYLKYGNESRQSLTLYW